MCFDATGGRDSFACWKLLPLQLSGWVSVVPVIADIGGVPVMYCVNQDDNVEA